MKKLPEYKGWTVDFKLKEFRNFHCSKCQKTLEFDSWLGDMMLTEMIKKGLVPKKILVNLF